MKVLVLGVGMMGYGLLKDLDAQKKIDEIHAVDINIEQAKQYAKRVGGNKITVGKLDVTDKKAMAALMKGYDVVASAVPRPFCDAAVEAAIEAKVDYADIAAGFSTIFSLDEKAKKAGISVVPHIGLDVGIDRVLCGVGARKLDNADSFYVWCGGFPAKGTEGYNNPLRYKISWYWPYAVNSNLSSSTVLIDGKEVRKDNLSSIDTVTFPEPIGETEAYVTSGLMDVPEHLGLTDIKNAVAKTLRWPGHRDIWMKLREIHLLDQEEIDVKGVKVKPYDVFIALGFKHLQYNPDESDAICQRVTVSGTKDDKPTSYSYEFVHFHDFENDISAMAKTTAWPCSIVAQMMANGEFNKKGVVHPAWLGYDEKLSDKFFSELGKRGINITESKETGFN